MQLSYETLKQLYPDSMACIDLIVASDPYITFSKLEREGLLKLLAFFIQEEDDLQLDGAGFSAALSDLLLCENQVERFKTKLVKEIKANYSERLNNMFNEGKKHDKERREKLRKKAGQAALDRYSYAISKSALMTFHPSSDK